MRVGSVVFATDQGLGYLAKSFYDNGVVTHPIVLRHGRREDHLDWYLGAPVLGAVSQLMEPGIAHLIASMDAMLFFETPFEWRLLDFCRRAGVKTALMPMHECMPEVLPSLPDTIVCPSMLDYDCYDARTHNDVVFVPVPVDVPWRQRTRAEVFVHNAGNGGLRGRNGTAELMAATFYIKKPAKLLIRSQVPLPPSSMDHNYHARTGGDVLMFVGQSSREELYDGDVFVFPEKFNGLSLPLQEAHAAGMMVMATDRHPMNAWLPIEAALWRDGRNTSAGFTTHSPLIPTSGSHRARVARHLREFDEAEVDPRAIAAKIDEWYGRDISELSLGGKRWAEAHSWAALKPRYLEVLSK